jgi:hypothetical protein
MQGDAVPIALTKVVKSSLPGAMITDLQQFGRCEVILVVGTKNTVSWNVPIYKQPVNL